MVRTSSVVRTGSVAEIFALVMISGINSVEVIFGNNSVVVLSGIKPIESKQLSLVEQSPKFDSKARSKCSKAFGVVDEGTLHSIIISMPLYDSLPSL